MTAQQRHRQRLQTLDEPIRQRGVVLLVCAIMVIPTFLSAQTADPTGLKRKFLDRYLDCAEAPNDTARLACFDRLLIDIPAWLDALLDLCQTLCQPPSNGKQSGDADKQHRSD